MRKALTAKSAEEDRKARGEERPALAGTARLFFANFAAGLRAFCGRSFLGGKLFFEPTARVSSLFPEATCAVYKTNES
jgi:hypothetical protein